MQWIVTVPLHFPMQQDLIIISAMLSFFLSTLVQQTPMIIVRLITVVCFSHTQWPIEHSDLTNVQASRIHSKHSPITSIVLSPELRWPFSGYSNLTTRIYLFSLFLLTAEMAAPINLLTRWQHLDMIPSDESISICLHQMAAHIHSTRWLYLFSTHM